MLILTVAGLIIGVWTLRLVIDGARLAVDEAAESRKAEQEAFAQGESLRREMRRNADAAVAADSARQAEAAQQRARTRAETVAAAENERQRQRELVELDGEMRLRVGLLLDSLAAAGLETPNPTREGGDYTRMTRAFERFVSPRNGMSRTASGLTTYALLGHIQQRDTDSAVGTATLYLMGITTRGTYRDLSSGVWFAREAPPGTPVMSFREPNTNRSREMQVAEVVKQFKLRRWTR